uniref:Uncharacterized protein n=1 Tax=Helianthus annuus TaxID=4232 RepID=A0A251VMA1_HELAN
MVMNNSWVLMIDYCVSYRDREIDSGRKKTAFLTFKDPEALEFALLLSAVLRDLYAYFADRPMKEIPHIEVTKISLDHFCSNL